MSIDTIDDAGGLDEDDEEESNKETRIIPIM